MDLAFSPKTSKKLSFMMESFTEVSGQNKSEWEEGLAVISDILTPGSAVNDALTPQQRTGLQNVRRILLGTGGEDDCKYHLPSELRQSTNGDSAIDAYLLTQFAGVKHASAKQKFKSVVNANLFIAGLRNLTGGDASETTFKQNIMWTYLPPEWEDMEMDARRQVSEMLSKEALADWGFDVFKLDELTNGNALLFIGYGILSSPYSQHAMQQSVLGEGAPEVDVSKIKGYKFLEELNISAITMVNFLRAIQKDYVNENPYHNSIHAADVTQSVHSLLQMGGEKFSNGEIQIFSILLAAVIHDVGHPGKNNNFQIHSKSDFALQYNDQSILENMHLSKAFTRVLGNGGNTAVDIFKKMKPKQYSSVRSMMIEAVLHTDMTKHFASVNLLKGLMLSNPTEELFGTDHSWTILHFLLHLADISNPAKPGPMFEAWTDRCLEEFFTQGDEEKKMGLPVSPLCDRESTDRAESQIGFIQYVVMPAFKVMSKCIPKVEEVILPIIEDNLDFWILEAKRGKQTDEEEDPRSFQKLPAKLPVATVEEEKPGAEEDEEEI
ncbi:MAG: hypothetical protein SGBAC_006296 [Bacillariaceae sp.]